ncbi:hypothetical protein SLE2022_002450 [Rubroshorea leprosula]
MLDTIFASFDNFSAVPLGNICNSSPKQEVVTGCSNGLLDFYVWLSALFREAVYEVRCSKFDSSRECVFLPGSAIIFHFSIKVTNSQTNLTLAYFFLQHTIFQL